jgi:hypothetical protein
MTAADNLFRKYGKKFSMGKLTTMLSGDDRNISELDLEDLTPEEKLMLPGAQLDKKFLPDKAMGNDAQIKKADTKKNAAEANPKGANQSGV